ncbi:acyl-CoA/acyl-ACP dehydrogenase [Polynucleobacter sp. 30F-ANTBAC]|jgi:alkylation response protein AidB-like acyl-CoA dehydrogenase|uniref:acyl-CoA dehydrogenase family protein n=1 Tax=Polynucleobacter sp. 30F-ANTBAC TaxID=2689095 RepID=UPI001C0D4379|nr:acyl-CoA dehydrogenase family protein [Polynucleobacter sp. 30F-ANTBAC]MBU3600420.1 acyl-CoA/acyl-ACP dehydrogenase [Polynucleobacter sp. 30F-ANTBAC]
MNFNFTDDQLVFRDVVRKFLMVEAAPEVLREIWAGDAGRSPDLRKKFTEQGLTSISVAEEFGGLGMGDIDWCLIHQELGYFAIPDSLIDTAYISAGIFSDLLQKNPSNASFYQNWLTKIVDGSARIAISHPINPLVCDAAIADLVIVFTNDEIHIVPRKDYEVDQSHSIDLSRRLYAMKWTPTQDSCHLKGPDATEISDRTLNRANLAITGQLLGLSQRMLDASIDYTSNRKQFGKAIGSFQAVKHHLADVAIQLEFAKPVYTRAAYSFVNQQPLSSINISHAKLAAAKTAWLSAKQAIQVHGAMGYTWEVDLQMFMKRAWALDASWGNRGFHKKRISQWMLSDGVDLSPANNFQGN